jgi:hypothetical protein
MDDATLIITARSRPDYLRRTLASWAEVPEVTTLRRVIVKLGASERYDEQYDVIRSSALSPGIVLDSAVAESIPGEHYSLGEAISHVLLEDPDCGYVIHGSEDVVVSDDVLRYMAWARKLGTFLVCAHNELGQGWHPERDDTDFDQSAVRMTNGFSPWVWGFGRIAWQDVLEPAWDWDCTSGPNDSERGWDWQVHRIAQAWAGPASAIPDASRALNIGELGGTYARPEDYPRTVARSFRQRRGEVPYKLVTW